jgi:UDP-N-acetylglucosamine/UDP-N-acetylgalactosamine diphosphorylase
LIFGGASKSGNIAFTPGAFSNMKRIFNNNIYYIANLLALLQWYQHARYQFLSDEFPIQLFEGVLDKLDMAVNERIKRLEDFIKRSSTFKISSEKLKEQNQELVLKWPQIKELIHAYQKNAGDDRLKNRLIQAIQKISETAGNDYLEIIKHLPPEEKENGTRWLQGIVEQMVNDINNKVEDKR